MLSAELFDYQQPLLSRFQLQVAVALQLLDDGQPLRRRSCLQVAFASHGLHGHEQFLDRFQTFISCKGVQIDCATQVPKRLRVAPVGCPSLVIAMALRQLSGAVKNQWDNAAERTCMDEDEHASAFSWSTSVVPLDACDLALANEKGEMREAQKPKRPDHPLSAGVSQTARSLHDYDVALNLTHLCNERVLVALARQL